MQIRLIIRPRDRMDWMEDLRVWVASLRERGHDVVPRITFEADDAVRMAREAAEAGADLIVAAGGDGTVNGVVNGVAGESWDGDLAILPLGTANDFALGLGIPEDLSEALEVAVSGSTRTVDIAQVNDRYFANVSTGGVAAGATEEASSGTKRVLGSLAYVLTGVQKLPDLEPQDARFTTPEGEAYKGGIMLFAVGNGTQTGAGSRLTPEAELDDGELDVLIVPGMSRMEFMALAPRLRSGAHVGDPDIRYFKTPELTVEGGEGLAVNADGEPVVGDRFVYRIRAGHLTLRVP